jgi:hypothetical protein
MNQEQFASRNQFKARSPYSALFDRLNPPYSATAQALAPEFGAILPSDGRWNLCGQWSLCVYVLWLKDGAE